MEFVSLVLCMCVICMQVLILVGIDILVVILEWVLLNLLNYLDVLKKVRNEIDCKVGLDRFIDELDIFNLLYFQNIVCEMLCLYFFVFMLFFYVVLEDCKVVGYDMFSGMILLINVWVIYRDLQLWEDFMSFKFERFEKEGEFNKLMFFGLGRRVCFGLGLVYRLVNLIFGLLIQCLEWERIGEEKVDMSECKGGIMFKVKFLEVMCRVCIVVGKIFYEGV